MAFKVGDKVVNDVYGKGEIVYGPYGGEFYFFKREDGAHHTVSESLCKPAAKFKVDDRVQTIASTYIIEAGPFFAPDEWYAVRSDRTDSVLQGWAEELSLVAPEPAKNEAIVNGIAYDLTARYRDTDGDYWTFKDVDGTVRGNCSGTNHPTDVFDWCDTLADAVRKYGPLTRT